MEKKNQIIQDIYYFCWIIMDPYIAMISIIILN